MLYVNLIRRQLLQKCFSKRLCCANEVHRTHSATEAYSSGWFDEELRAVVQVCQQSLAETAKYQPYIWSWISRWKEPFENVSEPSIQKVWCKAEEAIDMIMSAFCSYCLWLMELWSYQVALEKWSLDRDALPTIHLDQTHQLDACYHSPMWILSAGNTELMRRNLISPLVTESSMNQILFIVFWCLQYKPSYV